MATSLIDTEAPVAGPSVLLDPAVLSGVATERLEADITTLASHVAAATCQWLLLVGEYERRKGYEQWECISMVQWLGVHVGVSASTARAHVMVARSLLVLPLVREVFGRGELSFSRVRAICRVAVPGDEERWVTLAREATAGQLDRIVSDHIRVARAAEPDAAARQAAARKLRWWFDDDGMCHLSGVLSPEAGVLLAKELRRATGRITPSDDATVVFDMDGYQARNAAAFEHLLHEFVELDRILQERADAEAAARAAAVAAGAAAGASDRMGAGASAETTGDADGDGVSAETRAKREHVTPGRQRASSADADAGVVWAQCNHHCACRRSTGTDPTRGATTRGANGSPVVVVLHRFEDGTARLEDGPPVPPDVAERLADGAVHYEAIHEPDRITYKRRRTPTTTMRRALIERDKCCAFRGCEQRTRLHAHHIVEFVAENGETVMENLVMLCPRHHRAIHKRGWKISMPMPGTIVLTPPRGQTWPRPVEPSDPATIIGANVANGINPGPHTIEPRGRGERYDHELTIWGLANFGPARRGATDN